MEISPITLEGQHVRLEPLTQAHAEPLIDAASDGELWHSIVTIVPARDTVAEDRVFFSYRRACLRGEPVYGRTLSAIALSD